MAKRPRTERRRAERAAKAIVRDREKLAAMTRGGSRELPIDVPSSAVIEGRATNTPCVQCEGEYRVLEHLATAGLREVRVACRTCGAPRTLWFRIVPDDPN